MEVARGGVFVLPGAGADGLERGAQARGIFIEEAALEVGENQARAGRPIARRVVNRQPGGVAGLVRGEPLAGFGFAQPEETAPVLGEQQGGDAGDPRADVFGETGGEARLRKHGAPVGSECYLLLSMV